VLDMKAWPGGADEWWRRTMLAYAAYTLIGFVMIGCLLYVTMSPEAEDAPNPKRPDQEP
jgi:hypothetical protein